MADKNYVYYVEGQCEEKLLKILKTDMRLIQPGKVIKRNVIQDKLRQAQLKTLKKGTTAVLVLTQIQTTRTFYLKISNYSNEKLLFLRCYASHRLKIWKMKSLEAVM